MAAPPIAERHLPHFHRRAPMKEACRVATTANITISTALNNGDSLDGITLATGDRVLVKSQSTGSQNGIYEVGVSPARAYDLSTDDPSFGFLVYVREGTTNGGTLWENTNTSTPTIDTTALTFSQVTGGGSSFATPSIVLGSSAAAGAASTVIRSDSTIAAFDATAPTTQAFGDAAAVGSAAFAARRDHKHAWPTAAVTTSGLTQATARLLGRTTASTGAIEEISVGTGLSLSGGSLSATAAGASYSTGIPWIDSAGNPDRPAGSPNAEDDEFDAGSLDAKWTDVNTVTETFAGSRMIVPNNAEYRQAYVPGASTAFTITMKWTGVFLMTTVVGVGIIAYDAGNAMVAAFDLRESVGLVRWNRDNPGGAANATWNTSVITHDVYLRISRDASNNYLGSFSFDGVSYQTPLASTSSATAITKVGFRVIDTSGATWLRFGIDWFRRT